MAYVNKSLKHERDADRNSGCQYALKCRGVTEYYRNIHHVMKLVQRLERQGLRPIVRDIETRRQIYPHKEPEIFEL